MQTNSRGEETETVYINPTGPDFDNALDVLAFVLINASHMAHYMGEEDASAYAEVMRDAKRMALERWYRGHQIRMRQS